MQGDLEAQNVELQLLDSVFHMPLLVEEGR